MYEKIKLDYSCEDLEPIIDSETVYIHYNKHYQNYLNNLNKLLQEENYDYRYSKEDLVNNINIFNIDKRGEILYNLGGVINHELYFSNISDKNNNYPTGILLNKINEQYGSYDNFKQEFISIANNLKGSGYTFLTLDKNNKFKIISTSNQDTPYSYGLIPIMTIDLWEHAYYLKYKNNRPEYINNFFKIIDYQKVSNNLSKHI